MRLDLPTAVLIGLVIILWGLWGFFGKVALTRQMPPLSVFYAEVTIGFMIGAAMLAALYGRGQLPWRQSWNIAGVISGAALAFGLLLYYLALERSTAAVVVPLTAAYPVVTVLLSVVILSERLTVAQWVGVALVGVGMILLLSSPASSP